MKTRAKKPVELSLHRSLVEEIIACLWTLIAIELWRGQAPDWMVIIAGMKAASDHACAIKYAL